MITLPPESPTHTTTTTTTNTNPVSHFIQTTLSYDSNVMLAAIISLLVVILFVLLLHIYARWFLVQARQRSRSSVTVPHVLGSRFHRFTITDVDTIHDHSSPSKGLHPSFISSLPLFVYQYSPAEDNDVINSQGTLECAICISLFEEDEVGRRLPKCGHAFHVECIDMWLDSHSTCPICRAAIVCELPTKMDTDTDSDRDHGSLPEIEICPNARSENNHEMFNNAANVPVENHDDAGIRLLETSLGESLRRMLSSSRVERKAHADHNNVVTHESEV